MPETARKFENNETRSYTFEMRAGKDGAAGNFVEGTAVVFNARTDLGPFDEVIAPGALDRTDMKDVRFLVNHDTGMIPLARSRNNNGNSTMLLTAGEDGLKVRISLDTENNTEARNLYSAISRGDVSGMSFMFTVRGEQWDGLDGGHPTRTITDIERIYEVSAVTFPAYEQTDISARCRAQLESCRELLESRKRQEESERLRIRNGADARRRKIALMELE